MVTNARKVLPPALLADDEIMDGLQQFTDAHYELVLTMLNRAYLHGAIAAAQAARAAKGA